ncbi:MAG: efflux RND transporter periplasmic adaptor subunit [Bacteroidales bacterium]|nr:efflux RND transporter periplasmic adaptor subunit [Bacteroidales bacterium]
MSKLSKKTKWIIAIAAIVLLALILFFVLKKGKHTEMQINTVRSTIDSIEVTVTATGELQPVYKVDVGTQVSGIVEHIYVDFNTVVKKGQKLAELDRSNLNEQLTQAQTSVSNAKSNLTLAQQQYDRIKSLYDNKAATQESYESAVNSLNLAKNQLKTAQSELSRAQTNLSYATIYSPIDGVIMDKAVEEGQTVASSFSTPTLFTIANDLTQMQVQASVDEADIGEVKAGQPVTFTVDAFPDDVFTGTVKEVRINPTVTANVVTYTVIINAPNPETKLFPGMTASVTIVTKKESGVCIPMTALYASLDQDKMKQFEKKGYTFKTMYRNQEEMAQGLKDITKKTIWVKKGDMTYEQVRVAVGLNNGVTTLVTDGLELGEEVVIGVSEALPNMPQGMPKDMPKDMPQGMPEGKQQKDGKSNPFMPGPPQQKKR